MFSRYTGTPCMLSHCQFLIQKLILSNIYYTCRVEEIGECLTLKATDDVIEPPVTLKSDASANNPISDRYQVQVM